MANLWLIIISGSIFNKLDQAIGDPGSIVDLLGQSVPNKAQVKMVEVAYVCVAPIGLRQSER